MKIHQITKSFGFKSLSVVGLASFCVIPLALNYYNANASLDGRAYFDPNDSDSDGMSDEWEEFYFGDITARDGSEDDDLDDILNVDEYVGGTDPLFLNPYSIGESGRLVISSPERGLWQTVRLEGVYNDPVIVVGPATPNGIEAVSFRVRNVTSTSFEINMNEFDFNDGYHIVEEVSWLAIEKGVHTLPSGQVIQAGYRELNEQFSSISFEQEFSEVPVVMSQVVSENGDTVLVTRQRDVTSLGFSAALQEQESFTGEITDETVSWIAIEKGVSEALAGPIEVASRDGFSHRWL